MRDLVESILTAFKVFLRCAILVGRDEAGNSYYESRNIFTGTPKKPKRWILYGHLARSSVKYIPLIPSPWHGWLHFYGGLPLASKESSPEKKPLELPLHPFDAKDLPPPVKKTYVPWSPQ